MVAEHISINYTILGVNYISIHLGCHYRNTGSNKINIQSIFTGRASENVANFTSYRVRFLNTITSFFPCVFEPCQNEEKDSKRVFFIVIEIIHKKNTHRPAFC